MIVALVLAAGYGARFEHGKNKLFEDIRGAPLLRHAIDAASESRVEKTFVVTGFDHARVAHLLSSLPVTLIRNPDYAEGMASSLREGIKRAGDASGAVVLLGDMPNISGRMIDRMIEVFEKTDAAAVVPTYRGQRGNPALLGRSLFPALMQLSGDQGARKLLTTEANVIEVEVDDPGILADVDTAYDLAQLRAAPDR